MLHSVKLLPNFLSKYMLLGFIYRECRSTLYIQVCDHLKDAAKFLGIHVVPIVGGLSMEKQERLLKKKPEIVVGTPGRLWEHMSMNNQHLVEVSTSCISKLCTPFLSSLFDVFIY